MKNIFRKTETYQPKSLHIEVGDVRITSLPFEGTTVEINGMPIGGITNLEVFIGFDSIPTLKIERYITEKHNAQSS